MKDLIAYCGLDCEKCDARIATINNDNALREKTAKVWSELNQVEITAEHINCMGCRTKGVKTVYCDSMCEIRKCVENSKLETCANCTELENCNKVSSIHLSNPEALKNLKNM